MTARQNDAKGGAMTARARVTKPAQLLLVHIGLETVLLPMDKGIKLVELLQHGQRVSERFYHRQDKYYTAGMIQVETRFVLPDQVHEGPPPELEGGT